MLRLLVLSMACGLGAQEVKVAPLWKAGDVIRFDYVKSREDSRRPQNNGTGKTPVELHVVSRDEKGSTLRWVSQETVLPPGLPKTPEVESLLAKGRDMQLLIRVNPDGEYESIVNADEVMSRANALLDELLKLRGAKAGELEAMKSVLNPEFLLAAVANDAKTYFGLYGLAMKPGEKISTRIQVPFPLAPGQTIGADMIIELVSATPELARFRTETRYVAEDLLRATSSIFKKAGVPESEWKKMPPLEMEDRAEATFDRRTGLFREIRTERRNELKGAFRRVDKKAFVLAGK